MLILGAGWSSFHAWRPESITLPRGIQGSWMHLSANISVAIDDIQQEIFLQVSRWAKSLPWYAWCAGSSNAWEEAYFHPSRARWRCWRGRKRLQSLRREPWFLSHMCSMHLLFFIRWHRDRRTFFMWWLTCQFFMTFLSLQSGFRNRWNAPITKAKTRIGKSKRNGELVVVCTCIWEWKSVLKYRWILAIRWEWVSEGEREGERERDDVEKNIWTCMCVCVCVCVYSVLDWICCCAG